MELILAPECWEDIFGMIKLSTKIKTKTSYLIPEVYFKGEATENKVTVFIATPFSCFYKTYPCDRPVTGYVKISELLTELEVRDIGGSVTLTKDTQYRFPADSIIEAVRSDLKKIGTLSPKRVLAQFKRFEGFHPQNAAELSFRGDGVFIKSHDKDLGIVEEEVAGIVPAKQVHGFAMDMKFLNLAISFLKKGKKIVTLKMGDKYKHEPLFMCEDSGVIIGLMVLSSI